MIDIYLVFLLEIDIVFQDTFQKISLLTNRIFLANKIIYFWNKLSNQIKNSDSVETSKIKLNYFRKEKKIKVFLGIIKYIWSVYRYCISSVDICAKILF